MEEFAFACSFAITFYLETQHPKVPYPSLKTQKLLPERVLIFELLRSLHVKQNFGCKIC